MYGPLNERGDEIFASGAPDLSAMRDVVAELALLDPPDEIADDYLLVIEAFTLYAEGLAGDTAAAAELAERFDEFDAADERIEPYFRDVCGIEYGD